MTWRLRHPLELTRQQGRLDDPMRRVMACVFPLA
jgi:hypothetical protein